MSSSPKSTRRANLNDMTFSLRWPELNGLFLITTPKGTFEVPNNFYSKETLEAELKNEGTEAVITEEKITPSKMIVFTNTKNGAEQYLFVRKNTQKQLYNLITNYHKGRALVSREERYRNMYIVYEALSKNPKIELRAIRHAISHPKLRDKKIIKVLRKLFNDDNINLSSYQHAKTFKRWENVLKDEAYLLLRKRLVTVARTSTRKRRMGIHVLV
jgi:hypothetical protein